MTFTIARLAKMFSAASEMGHGDLEVKIHVPADPELLRTLSPDTGPITPMMVVRQSNGRWFHSCYPNEWDVPMATWLRRRGFDFTVTLLIVPEDGSYSPEDISRCELRRPTGDKWFLWEISVNADGTPIAVWIAPIN